MCVSNNKHIRSSIFSSTCLFASKDVLNLIQIVKEMNHTHLKVLRLSNQGFAPIQGKKRFKKIQVHFSKEMLQFYFIHFNILQKTINTEIFHVHTFALLLLPLAEKNIALLCGTLWPLLLSRFHTSSPLGGSCDLQVTQHFTECETIQGMLRHRGLSQNHGKMAITVTLGFCHILIICCYYEALYQSGAQRSTLFQALYKLIENDNPCLKDIA